MQLANIYSKISHLNELFFKPTHRKQKPELFNNLFEIPKPYVRVHAPTARVLRGGLSELFALYRVYAPIAGKTKYQMD